MNTPKIHIVLILLGLLVSNYGMACQCETKKLSEWQEEEFLDSEFVFIGEIIEINEADLTYKVKVIEKFKGNLQKEEVFIGKNWKYCSPYVSSIGQWIIYGHMEDEFLRLNYCGISRPFDNPILIFKPPTPEVFGENMTEKERNQAFEQLRIESLEKAKIDLDLEIKALKNRNEF